MNNQLKTPGWVDALIDSLAPLPLAEEIRGDLYEIFQKEVAERGIRSARWRYIFNALGFLGKKFFWRSSRLTSNPAIMLGGYFKMAGRSLSAYRGTAIINMLGLVIGIASALVILAVIRFELGFNKFHSDTERIYRVVRVSGADMSEFRTGISYPVPTAIRNEVPALEQITSVEYLGGAYVDVTDASGNAVAKFREDFGCVLVEPTFFDIFDFADADFKWIGGNPETALLEPFNVVLTESMAKKYFPDGDAVGKAIRFEKYYDAKITGVVSDLPSNGDFPFTIFIAYSTLDKMRPGRLNNWISVNDPHQAFVKLSPGVTKEQIEEQIAAVHARHTSKDLYSNRHYLLQSLSDMHHDPRFATYSGRTISHETVFGLAIVGLFLLLTASINYINLSTAQSAMRSREIGIRKVLGSNRMNLMGQFMVETFILVSLAGMAGLILAELVLLNMQSLLSMPLETFNLIDPFLLLCLLLIIVAVTILAGLYPSLVVSRLNPVNALKNKFGSSGVGNINLRKVLVVAQFSITQMLVVGTFIVVSQMKFFQEVNMGFNREAIINLKLPATSKPELVAIISDKLASESIVSGYSFSSTIPSGLKRNRNFMGIGNKDASEMNDFLGFESQIVDSRYLDVYGIKVLAGRSLEARDSNGNVLINRTLMGNLGFTDPHQVIDQELKMGGGGLVTVVGVIDDYYSNSLKEQVDNIVLSVNRLAYDYCSIKVNVSDDASMKNALLLIERLWNTVYPEHLFSYQFFDENILAFYAQEEKYAKLFQIFSIIFLFIGCLGLYGLITFVVNRKSREVAIRKVLGATVRNILFLFSTEYVKLIIISFVLAVPVTYYLVDDWLGNFAHHLPLQWWFFVLPGLFVLGIALLVVVAKSIRTAHANPVERLKYE